MEEKYDHGVTISFRIKRSYFERARRLAQRQGKEYLSEVLRPALEQGLDKMEAFDDKPAT